MNVSGDNAFWLLLALTGSVWLSASCVYVVPQERLAPSPAPVHSPAGIDITPREALPISRGAVTYVLPGSACPPELPDPQGRVRLGAGGAQPPLLAYVPPEYSPRARERGARGLAILEVRVEKDGRVTEATILRPIDPDLAKAAIQAVRKWRFAQACFVGRPIPEIFTVTVPFRPE